MRLNWLRWFLLSVLVASLLPVASCAPPRRRWRRQPRPVRVVPRRPVVVVPAPAPPPVVVVAPPRPKVEKPGPPPPGKPVWITGHWKHEGSEWVWVNGHYVGRPRPNAKWTPGHWAKRPRGWVWVPGHWN